MSETKPTGADSPDSLSNPRSEDHSKRPGHHDAIIIGAGVIGCAVALALTKRGIKPLVIDRLPGAGYGSTSSSSGIIRFGYSTEAGVAMAWEGHLWWKDWRPVIAPATPDATVEFLNYPMLMLDFDGGRFDRVLPFYDRLGVPYERLDHDALLARYPFLDLHRFGPPVSIDDDAFWRDPQTLLRGAISTPDSGFISDPMLASQNLAEAAEHLGARFMYRTEIVGIETEAGRVSGVRLADGSVESAPIVVNVAGPWSSVVNEMAGVRSSMNVTTRALRREVFVVPAGGDIDFDLAGVMIGDEDTGVYLRPERTNNVLIGSTEPACDELEWIDDPNHFKTTLSDDEHQLLVLRCARRIPSVGVPQRKRGVVDLYDVSDDWTPVYDKSSLAGFYMAVGSSGNQFKNAPIAGHCMAELIEAVEGGHNHDFDPLVITGPRSGLDIDMATFSRNRTLGDASTMTVLG